MIEVLALGVGRGWARRILLFLGAGIAAGASRPVDIAGRSQIILDQVTGRLIRRLRLIALVMHITAGIEGLGRSSFLGSRLARALALLALGRPRRFSLGATILDLDGFESV